ncbi:MAG: hypothetical protein RIT11_1161 [Pseudomonadota bacterium]
MSGALGMLASTLPVQLLLPIIGWRSVFVVLGILIVISFILILFFSPSFTNLENKNENTKVSFFTNYLEIWKNPYFRSLTPIGFFNYGGLVAIITLWAGPWMTQVSGYNPLQSATGLFWLHFTMLIAFGLWGLINPYILKKGITADKIITYGLPSSLIVLLFIIYSGSNAGALHWTLFVAGKALSAYNLVIFLGVFVVQWGIGIIIDVIKSFGFDNLIAYQSAFFVFFICCTGSYIYFLTYKANH